MSGLPDEILPYFESLAKCEPDRDQFAHAVALIRRWQALASACPVDVGAFNALLGEVEAEPDPGSGWFDLWIRLVAWGVARGFTAQRSNPWARDFSK